MSVDSDDELREILDHDTVAVVGCSTTEGKAAHEIPRYLQQQGYRVIPVNPFADEVLGEQSYDSITDVPDDVDVVDVFRPSDEVPDIVDETLERDDVAAVWLQQGIRHDDAADRAEEAGLDVVQDKCMKVEHQRLAGGS